MRTSLPVVLLLVLSGCSGIRFTIDAIPAQPGLAETTVLRHGSGSSKVAMIDVSGTIQNARPQGLLGEGVNPMSRFVEALEKARRDEAVRAVLLSINSRGGTVTASDLMYNELRRFREETGKPVVVLMGDFAASGGYYIACAADELMANPTTMTGSIGVIFTSFDLSTGMDRLGIRANMLTSGRNKAMASPFQPMGDEHRALMQDMVDELYARFRAIVIERRPELDPSLVDEVTDGRVVSGERALEVGLIDGLGDMRDAFARARDLAGLSGARLVRYHDPAVEVGSAYAEVPDVYIDIDLPTGEGGFWYLWVP